MAAIADFLVWYLVFIFSTTCHEAAHAYVAKRGGDDTAYSHGHVTLDPLSEERRLERVRHSRYEDNRVEDRECKRDAPRPHAGHSRRIRQCAD